jgi:prepilin-type processing-associated H-X9-DG protein
MQNNFLLEGARFDSRHNEGLNVVYADGHAKWRRLSTIYFRNLNWQASPTTVPPENEAMPYP